MTMVYNKYMVAYVVFTKSGKETIMWKSLVDCESACTSTLWTMKLHGVDKLNYHMGSLSKVDLLNLDGSTHRRIKFKLFLILTLGEATIKSF